MFGTILAFAAAHMLYFALHLESGSFPKPLTAQEEKTLFLRYREGSTEARGQLISHNLRLVAHIAKKYYARAAEQEDLVSIGTIGLMKAVDTFDSTRSARFSTYAARCIENEILMTFRADKKTQGMVFMQDPLESGEGDKGLTLHDVLADTCCPQEETEEKEEVRKLYEAVEGCLSGRQKTVIRMRYGLYGQPVYTQQQIARKLGISRSYVSRLEKKALKCLENGLKNWQSP